MALTDPLWHALDSDAQTTSSMQPRSASIESTEQKQSKTSRRVIADQSEHRGDTAQHNPSDASVGSSGTAISSDEEPDIHLPPMPSTRNASEALEHEQPLQNDATHGEKAKSTSNMGIYDLGFTGSLLGEPSKEWRNRYEARLIRRSSVAVDTTRVTEDDNALAVLTSEFNISEAQLRELVHEALRLGLARRERVLEYIRQRAYLIHAQAESARLQRQSRNVKVLTVLSLVFIPLSFVFSLLEMNLSDRKYVWTSNACAIGLGLLNLHFATGSSFLWYSFSRDSASLRMLEWDCTCGRRAHGRYAVKEANEQSRLMKELPNCRIADEGYLPHNWRYMALLIRSRFRLVKVWKTAKQQGQIQTSTQKLSVPESPDTGSRRPPQQSGSTSASSNTDRGASSVLPQGTISESYSFTPNQPSKPPASAPDNILSAASASASSSPSYFKSAADPPAFFELCVNRGDLQISLGEIQLVDALGQRLIYGDTMLISEIRKRYCDLRRKGLFSYLYRPADIHWVRFGVQQRGVETGIYESPRAMPPAVEVKEGRYHYHECPLEDMPPIAKETFFHYFRKPHKTDPARTVFTTRMPKKLGSSIFCQYDPDKLQFGWGMHIIEGPNKPLIAWLAAAIVMLRFIVSVVYDISMKNKDSGFAIGQWMLAVLATSLASLYFHLADAV